MGKVTNPYKVAWATLMIVLHKGYPLDSWIAPIPKEDRYKMLSKGIEKLKLERQQKELPFND